MRIKLITTCPSRKGYLVDALEDYEQRLRHYCSYERIELAAVKKVGNQPEKLLKSEAAAFLSNIRKEDFVVLLDDKGESMSSEEFSSFLNKRSLQSSNCTVFLVGGAFGFDSLIRQRANMSISLSKMTFTHQMVRLIFTEQLYRAFTILKGEKYHHS